MTRSLLLRRRTVVLVLLITSLVPPFFSERPQRPSKQLGEIPCHPAVGGPEALVHEDILKEKWIQAYHWCEWWMRLPHLKMLCEAFTVNTSRARAPRDTNGVERVNQASKDSSTPGLLKAMENLYKKRQSCGLIL